MVLWFHLLVVSCHDTIKRISVLVVNKEIMCALLLYVCVFVCPCRVPSPT